MASRGLGTLTLDLIAKIGGFTGPMSQAERDLDKKSRAMQRRAKDMSTSINSSFKSISAGVVGFVAGFAASLLSAQVVIQGFNDAIDRADRLAELSERLGVSTEKLSAWGYAAEQSGTDLEGLNTGLTRFTKNVAAAMDASSKQADLFKAIGVSVKDADGNLRSVEELLPEVANAFKALNNATLESALAQEFFGKSGTNLLQLLNLGSEGLSEMEQRARDLGLVISGETAAAADEFNDEVASLKAVLGGLATQMAAEMLPAMTDLVIRLRDLVKDGNLAADMAAVLGAAFGGAASILETYTGAVNRTSNAMAYFAKTGEGMKEILRNIQTFGIADGSLAGGFRKLADAENEAAEAHQRLLARESGGGKLTGPDFSNVTKGFGVDLKTQAAEIAKRRKEAKELEDAVNKVLGGGPPKPKKAKGAGGKSDAEREAEKLKSSYDQLVASLNQQIALTGVVSETEKLRYQLANGELAKLSEAEKANLITLQQQAEFRQQDYEATQKQIQLDEQAQEAKDAESERIKDFISDMEFELKLMGLSNQEREREIALRYAGAEATEEQRKAIIDLTDRTMEASAAADFWDNAQQELSSSLYDLAKNADDAEDIVKNFFDSIADYITRMIAEAWAEKIANLFKSSTTSTSTQGGGGWAAVFGQFLSAFGGGKASGGSTMAGKFYRVNEDGPELLSVGGNDYLMMGNRMGTITPNNQFAFGGGGGVNLSQNFYTMGTETRKTREQKAREAGTQAAIGIRRTGR